MLRYAIFYMETGHISIGSSTRLTSFLLKSMWHKSVMAHVIRFAPAS